MLCPCNVIFILYLAPAAHLPPFSKSHSRNIYSFRSFSSLSICNVHSRHKCSDVVPSLPFLFLGKMWNAKTANLAITHHATGESQTWKESQVDIKATWHYISRFINICTSLWPRNLYSGNLF